MNNFPKVGWLSFTMMIYYWDYLGRTHSWDKEFDFLIVWVQTIGYYLCWTNDYILILGELVVVLEIGPACQADKNVSSIFRRWSYLWIFLASFYGLDPRCFLSFSFQNKKFIHYLALFVLLKYLFAIVISLFSECDPCLVVGANCDEGLLFPNWVSYQINPQLVGTPQSCKFFIDNVLDKFYGIWLD